MERFIDRAVVLACCSLSLAVAPWGGAHVVALLAAVAAGALSELVRGRWGVAPAIAYAAVSVVVGAFAVFLPCAVYDLARRCAGWPNVIWALAALAAVADLGTSGGAVSATIVALGCAVAALLGRRCATAERWRADNIEKRDALREEALAVESRYAELSDRQDLEVRLATLGERSRIAREIHDNVGHLLTRSVLQMKALQVIHRDDERLAGELSAVSATVNEALDAVRASVHDLHDDGFDLETQLDALASGAASLDVDVEYRCDEVPAAIGYSFLAIAREALSNTTRHSDAKRASIAVTEHPGFFRLVVRDDGSADPCIGEGPSATNPQRAGGIGLTTMRDRATALGGVFRAWYDRGFTVLVSVPRENADATPDEESAPKAKGGTADGGKDA